MSYTVPSTRVRREDELRFLDAPPPLQFPQTQSIFWLPLDLFKLALFKIKKKCKEKKKIWLPLLSAFLKSALFKTMKCSSILKNIELYNFIKSAIPNVMQGTRSGQWEHMDIQCHICPADIYLPYTYLSYYAIGVVEFAVAFLYVMLSKLNTQKRRQIW